MVWAALGAHWELEGNLPQDLTLHQNFSIPRLTCFEEVGSTLPYDQRPLH
jgi:hypothetical protein